MSTATVSVPSTPARTTFHREAGQLHSANFIIMINPGVASGVGPRAKRRPSCEYGLVMRHDFLAKVSDARRTCKSGDVATPVRCLLYSSVLVMTRRSDQARTR
ncbi:hypothetical protein L1887_56905 [Cichorium endivia]|nr:hypothetical protein L1887_56905 [Cichorium endivia]